MSREELASQYNDMLASLSRLEKDDNNSSDLLRELVLRGTTDATEAAMVKLLDDDLSWKRREFAEEPEARAGLITPTMPN